VKYLLALLDDCGTIIRVSTNNALVALVVHSMLVDKNVESAVNYIYGLLIPIHI